MKQKLKILAVTTLLLLPLLMLSRMDGAWDAVEAYTDLYVEICPEGRRLFFDSAETTVTVQSFQISGRGVCMVYSLEEGAQMTDEMTSCCPEVVLADGTVIRAELTTLTESQGEIRMESRFSSPVDLSQADYIRFGRLCLPLGSSQNT